MARPKTHPSTRFWPKVRKTDTCWLWTGYRMNNGYGTIGYVGEKKWLVHRLSWELTNGEIPDGMCVLHKCDVRNCVRPSHLFIGTQLDNMRDCSRKGRTNKIGNKGSKNGRSKITEAGVKEIRRLLGDGVQGATIARRFGLQKCVVSRIKCGSNWNHVSHL